jgi:uncharacterized protein YjbI with pentapeptide repeats
MSQPFTSIFDEYRQGERDFRKLAMPNANLRDAILPGINLEEAELKEANLQDADLSNAILRKADLTRANLRGANLHGTDLTGATLMGANLSGADLGEAKLDHAFLRLADFSEANLTSASLAGVDGRGWVTSSREKGVKAHRTSFQGAVLRKADLTDAYLRLCDFRGADLSEATLVTTDLSSVDGRPLTNEDQKTRPTLLFGANLRQASLRKAQFSYADFRKANLEGADLRETILGGSFKEADLSHALLFDTRMERCDLTGAKLTGANLEGCKFDSVRMPDGEPPGKDLEQFIGPPPNPAGAGMILKPPDYIEFWFETYEEIKVLSWPSFCVCCMQPFDRQERFTHDSLDEGLLKVYEVRVPYCTACLQHSVRSRNPRLWMKNTCAAPGGNAPAIKFEVKSRGMLSGKIYFVLTFANPEYVLGFASGNSLPTRGFKGNW